jgi:hypothetical protein
MAESEVHRRLKYAMARELFEMGYQSNIEIPNGEGGFIDVQGIRGKEIINIELVKTHMPDWVLFKIQSPEEIRYNLFERIVDRLTNRGRKHFHMDELRRNLVATKYFDNESASRYVKRMVDTRIIDEVDPIVGIINNKGRYIGRLPLVKIFKLVLCFISNRKTKIGSSGGQKHIVKPLRSHYFTSSSFN